MTLKGTIFLGLIMFFLISCKKEKPDNSNQGTTTEFDEVYGQHPLQKFNLITPANSDNTTKVAILVHGGGWVMGYHPDEEVTTFDGRYGWNLQEPLLEQGFAVVTMKYRTACYNTQPNNFDNATKENINNMVEDINLVIQKLKDNASQYNINPNHIQLVGESGGGHIVLYYGISSAAEEEVKSVVSMFGPTDLDAQDFKSTIYDVPLIMAQPPNYFLRTSSNCTSVTNQQVKTWSSLKSFADHDDILVNQANPFLDTLSTTFPYNMNNNMAMFITHGVDDALVPSSQAVAMEDAMRNMFGSPTCGENDFSCQLKLGLYDNCGHGWTGGNCSKTQVISDIMSWLNAH